ncbi:AfsR/SARP family transcriptional regulator [Micromonospora sp. BQ11]|uniref:AfsR/SARP family transcriptional regulator n=1 Tax=Micromonospora sp. BQ11 TaxID=3452212 RepID=UPI003F88A243
MEIKVLGELAVRTSGAHPALGTPKQKTVLALLAVQAGRLVTIDELVDELWPEDPPKSAVPNVRTYAANLRRTFEAAGNGPSLVLREGDGYRLRPGAFRVDLLEFTAESAEARESARRGNLEQAEELASRALGRWRGRMLAGVPLGPLLSMSVVSAQEQRLTTVELLAELRIALERPETAVPVLREALALDPLREPAHVLLVRAMHARGDHPGALAAYESARTALAEKLGIEPGAELRRVHRLVMEGGQTPAPVMEPGNNTGPLRPATPTSDTRRPAPASWLPRPVPYFVGRAEILVRLTAETRRLAARTTPVHVIEGMAGSGKTTTAVHLARLLRPSFPDAALFIDLRGHGDSGAVAPVAALGTLLRQLGVPSARIPAEQDYRAELWRRELAHRRCVVVLDNAATTDQVLPLLPSEPGAVVIVTTRRRLDGLDVSPPCALPLLTPTEGLALLESAAGRDRVAAEPETAAAVVRKCGFLPLAIRLAGARLAHRPAWRVGDLARLLDDTTSHLGHLAVRERTVAGAFATSYEPLSSPVKRLFRLLSVHPGPHFTVPMAAALAGEAAPTAARILDELVDCHLVEEARSGRYRMHDLIRRYSVELSLATDGSDSREAARVQLLDFVLHSALTAADVLESGLVRRQVPVAAPYRSDLVGPMDGQAVDWFEDERPNIVALVASAGENGHHRYAWQLARAVWRFCYIRAYFEDIIATHGHGLSAAEAVDDLAGTALMNNYLASALVRTGNYQGALDHLAAAVAACERQGDRSNLFRFRANLVAVYWLRGDLHEAVEVGEAAMRDSGGYNNHEVPSELTNLGLALGTLGRHEKALHIHRLHLFRARVNGDYFHILNALGHIGAVKTRMGHHAAAVPLLRASVALRERTGHRYAEAEVRNDLGVALRGLGQISAAIREQEHALQLAMDSGESHVEAAALNELGLSLAQSGDDRRSAGMFHAALRVATRISHPYEQGRALAGLAEHFVTTDPAEARRHWERALAIFRRMGVPECFEVERRLAETARVAPAATG